VSGAFIKELMRQAALRAALEQRDRTSANDVIAALDELLEARSALTRRLLGQPAEGAPPESAIEAGMPAMLRAVSAAGLPLPEEFLR
jgi:hypothetical protein